MSEIENYKNNLDSFLSKMQDSFVEMVAFNIDSRPTFDKATLPFEFYYCSSIVFTTNNGNYKIHTAMTGSTFDTFWVEPIESTESGDLIKSIQSKVMAVSCKNGYNDLAYKLSMEFDDFTLTIFAAEIYDTAADNYEYKMNDEMLLVFDNKSEAEKFETAANYA
jgi:hypothetical protein